MDMRLVALGFTLIANLHVKWAKKVYYVHCPNDVELRKMIVTHNPGDENFQVKCKNPMSGKYKPDNRCRKENI